MITKEDKMLFKKTCGNQRKTKPGECIWQYFWCACKLSAFQA